MKNPELFHKTISILVNAFQKNTLVHSDACGCAIGNLVSFYNGYKPVSAREDVLRYGGNLIFKDKLGMNVQPDWCSVHSFGNLCTNESQYKNFREAGAKQLESTGYCIDETCRIEGAFESVDSEIDKDGYLGLMAVVDVLMQIHEATTEEATTAKELFTTA